MRIEEDLRKKTIQLVSQDPYYFSLEFMRRMSEKGKILEKENKYATGGPFHRSDVVFDFVQHLDGYTSIRVRFFLMGENGTKNFLRIDIAPSFISFVEETGFFSKAFAEFYLENIFPVLRKIADGKMKEILLFSEASMKSV
jgi:hypothetical protein